MKIRLERREFLRVAFGSLLLVAIPFSTGCSSLRPPQASDPPPPNVGPMPNGRNRTFLDSLVEGALQALGHAW